MSVDNMYKARSELHLVDVTCNRYKRARNLRPIRCCVSATLVVVFVNSMLAAKKADLIATGSGFFVSSDGYFVTNYHVVKGASVIRIKRKDDVFDAKIARVDAVNDIAVLKAAGNFPFLSLGHAEAVMLGADVFTIGFPNPNLQGFAPKLTRGDGSGRSGLLDDPRMFQISIPLQPGNSGGPVVDDAGKVVAIISASLSAE